MKNENSESQLGETNAKDAELSPITSYYSKFRPNSFFRTSDNTEEEIMIVNILSNYYKKNNNKFGANAAVIGTIYSVKLNTSVIEDLKTPLVLLDMEFVRLINVSTDITDLIAKVKSRLFFFGAKKIDKSISSISMHLLFFACMNQGNYGFVRKLKIQPSLRRIETSGGFNYSLLSCLFLIRHELSHVSINRDASRFSSFKSSIFSEGSDTGLLITKKFNPNFKPLIPENSKVLEIDDITANDFFDAGDEFLKELYCDTLAYDEIINICSKPGSWGNILTAFDVAASIISVQMIYVIAELLVTEVVDHLKLKQLILRDMATLGLFISFVAGDESQPGRSKFLTNVSAILERRKMFIDMTILKMVDMRNKYKNSGVDVRVNGGIRSIARMWGYESNKISNLFFHVKGQ